MPIDARSYPAVEQEKLRFRAIEAVISGVGQTEVARLYGVTRQAVAKWVRAYRQDGKKALRNKRQGRPRGGRLRPWQVSTIIRTMVEKTPDSLQLGSPLWTRQCVAGLVRREYGLRLSRWTVERYLRLWGMVGAKFSDFARARRLAAFQLQYKCIRKVARSEGAEIYWGEIIPSKNYRSLSDVASNEPLSPDTSPYFSGHVFAAISSGRALKFLPVVGQFEVAVVIRFLERLVACTKCRIFLIVKPHPIFQDGRVSAWLETNSPSLYLFSLPTESGNGRRGISLEAS